MSSYHLNDKIDQVQHGNGRYRPNHRSFDIHRGVQRPAIRTAFHARIDRLLTVTAGNFVFFFFHSIFFRRVGFSLPSFIINLSKAFAIN